MTTLAELRTRWQQRGDEFRLLGALVNGEAVVREFLGDLERFEQSLRSEAITLKEASMLGGYSVDRLQHLVAAGQIENVGRRNRPRVRRCDVPIKNGHRLPAEAAAIQLSERRRIAASVITGVVET